jgi:hypothetical protein
MLHSGYTNETILRALSDRHFAETFELDFAAVKELRQANASPALLDALSKKMWEQRAQEAREAYQKRHEEALRRESPADRAARESENERVAAATSEAQSAVSQATPTSKVAPRQIAENGSYYGELNKNGVPKTVPVRGYYRKDGTYVRGYYRSAPGSRP